MRLCSINRWWLNYTQQGHTPLGVIWDTLWELLWILLVRAGKSHPIVLHIDWNYMEIQKIEILLQDRMYVLAVCYFPDVMKP